MSRPKYIASCSGGKDSVATLLLAAQHREPLDEAVFSEVMFDQNTSGEVPEHRDFIYDRLKPFCEKELGIKFTILHADKTYDDVFHHVITRGPHKGEVRGFAWAGMCAVNRDCKIPPVRKYNAALSPDTVSYVGIAEDEPKRLARLDGVTKVSLLAKYGMTEADAYKLCQDRGCAENRQIVAGIMALLVHFAGAAALEFRNNAGRSAVSQPRRFVSTHPDTALRSDGRCAADAAFCDHGRHAQARVGTTDRAVLDRAS